MNATRRCLLRGAVSSATLAVAVAAGLMRPRAILAAEIPRYFDAANSLSAALHALRASNPAYSPAIRILAPDIAEDGASVFVDFACALPNVDTVAIFADRNPQPLLAAFHLEPEVLPALQMRVKVHQTSNVWVFVRSNGQFYKAAKGVKVTIGGCGLGWN